MGRKFYPLGIVQESKFGLVDKYYMHKPKIVPEK